MRYSYDNDVDISNWAEEVGGGNGKQEPRATITHVVAIVARAGENGIAKKKLVQAVVDETGVQKSRAYHVVDQAEAQKAITRRRGDNFYVLPQRH